jgi:ABC-type lipoprotein export system ATPase subunit
LQKDVHLILADEPTGNLDPENEKFILKELRNLADSGITIVVVSHSGTIDTFCDRIIWL